MQLIVFQHFQDANGSSAKPMLLPWHYVDSYIAHTRPCSDGIYAKFACRHPQPITTSNGIVGQPSGSKMRSSDVYFSSPSTSISQSGLTVLIDQRRN